MRNQRNHMWFRMLFLLVIALILAVYRSHHHAPNSEAPKDYVLPNDNFDQATLDQIRSHLNQYHVAQTPQNHEVYMIRGGLGVANPRILGWDAAGNMIFATNQGTKTWAFQETSQNPATWKTQIPSKPITSKNAKTMTFHYTPVHWIEHMTESGRKYFQMDVQRQGPRFYFTEGHTFVVVDVSPGGGFPVGVMSHLVAIGDPVKP